MGKKKDKRLKTKVSKDLRNYGEVEYTVKGKNGSSLVTNSKNVAMEALKHTKDTDFMAHSVHY